MKNEINYKSQFNVKSIHDWNHLKKAEKFMLHLSQFQFAPLKILYDLRHPSSRYPFLSPIKSMHHWTPSDLVGIKVIK